MAELQLVGRTQRKPGARGTAVEIAGRAWLLADYVPMISPVWGRLFDQNLIRGQYEICDLHSAAIQLLYVNYDLSPEDAADLILTAETALLVRAVEAALFIDDRPVFWDQWALSALAANGIKPEDVPAGLLQLVLHQLVKTGRAVPPQDVVDSIQAVVARAPFGL